MIMKLGILVIAAYVYSAAALPPPCTCTRNFQPVCGADGVTYGNECLLGCAGARLLHAGQCAPQPDSCTCTRNYEPVCGTDGQTYNNNCLLNCATSTVSSLSLSHDGPCLTVNVVDPSPSCVCTDQYEPVCGSDGKTYGNDCELNCATAQNSGLSVAHAGECESVPQPSCICSRERIPVCGTDGQTYDNNCLLNCATAKDSSLGASHDGPCLTVKVVDPSPSCVCTEQYEPVCGSDGKTYGNDCELNCATAQNSGLSVAHAGECESVPQPSCICSRERIPVCGTDGQTYDNNCLLNCATAKDSSLGVSHGGPCLTVKVVDPSPSCVCTAQYEPVCGSDGKTYGNDCELNCATAQNSGLSVAHAGECESVPQPSCICSRERIPVCGTDGQTYDNNCLLNCATAKDSSLGVSHGGPCLTVKVVDPSPSCVCTAQYEPVCGSDGKTYGNDCELNCATAQNSGLSVAHVGECESVPQPSCICSREMIPVCGTDGQTYANNCLLNCATAKDSSLAVSHDGPCLTVKVVDPSPSCVCIALYQPVCGSDGKTYGNDCKLNCATAQNPGLTIAHNGTCESVSQPSCTCPREMNPVCGSDGNTYNNPCELNCATVQNPRLSIAHGGGCESAPQPSCICTREKRPVCGTDGNTYSNECLLNCAVAKDSSLSLSHEGACLSVNVVDTDDCE